MSTAATYVKDAARSLPQACDGDGTEDGYNAEMEVTVTGPLSYPTGGFTLTSIAADMTKIKNAWQVSAISTTSRNATLVRASGLSAADSKIKVFTLGAELAAGTTLTASSWSMILRGKGPLGS